MAGSADLTAAEGPAVTEPAEPEADLTAAEIPAAEPEAPPAPRMERRGLVLAGLAVATVLFGAFGILASVAAHDLRAASAAANAAIVDRAATNAVTRDVTRAVDTIFSYSYADTATTKAAAQRLLTGPAIKQYDQLFKLVEQQAPAQHLVVTTNVTQVGVEFLGAGRARVLVFANQQDTRSGTTQSSYAGAMFAVTAVQRGGGWKIENIDTFSR